MIALVVVGNGRYEYLQRAVHAANLLDVGWHIMVNDTGDADYARRLDGAFPHFQMVHHPQNLGMAAAVNSGWDAALAAGATHVFHLEEDFLVDSDIELGDMRFVLDCFPWLASLTLKRNSWAPEEHAAGGQIPLTEQRGDPVIERTALHDGRRVTWSEHHALFSLNPSLIPARTLKLGWPAGPLGVGNESGMTIRCLDAGMHFAYWGAKDAPPRAEHIGYQRGGEWQL